MPSRTGNHSCAPAARRPPRPRQGSSRARGRSFPNDDPRSERDRWRCFTALVPHPLNPRKDFESDAAEDALNELRESILLRGLMQPIVVRPGPEAGTWWIVDGERRFRAIQQANWDGDWDDDKPVPIVIREVDDREHLLLSLTANLQRADMTAIEEAVAFHASVHDFGMGTEDLANELGKSQRYVQQRIALLKLSAEDQERMRLPRDHPDHLSFKAARALSQTPREPERLDPRNPHLALFIAEIATTADELHGVWDGALKVETNLVWPVGWEDWFDYRSFSGDLKLNAKACAWLAELGWGEDEDKLYQNLASAAGEVRRDDGACITDVLREAYGSGEKAANDEPGSPPPSDPAPAPSFGSSLTDHEALLLVEIADKSERDPDPDLGSEGYTRVQAVPVSGAAASLVARNIIGFRQRGAVAFVTPRLHGSGAKAWLEQIGFYTHRDDVLFEMRTRVIGPRAIDMPQQYATPWLNPPDPFAPQSAATPQPAHSDDPEPTQPELIEATEEEKAARAAAENERHADARARAAVEQYARQIGDWMAFARFRGARDYFNPCFDAGPALSPEDMCVALIKAVVKGDTAEAGALLSTLSFRIGTQNSAKTLAQMPTDLIAQVVAEARETDATEGGAQ
ncbi:ParB/RepB/Spo0J family partition protein [Brevundimonas sp.]|uniref:ParB/RepB/Spo0J family partition protein n=1 Tax=Brevundimonas sp. TaxID=1871086 RepID=UPI0035AF25E1